MRRISRLLILLCVALGPTGTAAGQQNSIQPKAGPPPVSPKGASASLGFPALPLLRADLRTDTLRDIDRIEVRPDAAQQASLAVSSVSPIEAILNQSYTGTGYAEPYAYQLTPGYSPSDAAAPMLIAYHGFGSSAASVAKQTLLDELCAARGWFYLSVTGLDDQLFGTELCQQNVDAVIQYMLDTYSIDPDRLYMVGFSLGAGIAANYAATHRDPDGIMLAALGLVSGSYDWAMAYTLDPSIRAWMLNPNNFGTSPSSDVFAYQATSTLYHDAGSYPPLPGSVTAPRSLGWNLENTPAWIGWDEADTLISLPDQSARLVTLLQARGGTVSSHPVTGTLNPADGSAATHSWAVMDPVALVDFLEGHVVQRAPHALDVLLASDQPISFLDVELALPDTFGSVRANVDTATRSLALAESKNVSSVVFRLGPAGLNKQDVLSLTAVAPDARQLLVGVEKVDELPGYFTSASGELAENTEWWPDSDRTLVAVPASSTASLAYRAAPWETRLSLSPDPVPLGGSFQLAVQATSGPDTLWTVLSLEEQLLPLGPGTLLVVSPAFPALIQPLPLDASGKLLLKLSMPSDPSLTGLRLSLQGALLGPGGWVHDTSNPYALDVN